MPILHGSMLASFPIACNCDSTGSLDLVCDEYGGQCPCLPAAVGFTSIQGKQCNLCPFFSYLTPDGCAGKSPTDPLMVVVASPMTNQ